ncbi:MAG: sigma-70 family RNA polymerase sigma factor [Calditrichaeota bacterium]|nr:sigma-70 family RNA polymerase sigma factor [Calditrichota bacterium]
MTDAALLEKIRAGDEEAFREVVKKYEPRVAAIVIRMLGNSPEADDVGQETFIRFFNAANQFRGDASIATYLTRIAMNLSLNELKRKKRRSFFSLSHGDEEFDVPYQDRSGEISEAKELVEKALSKLEAKFRAVVVLRLIEGYSTTETSEILGLPTGTVLSRLARGQKKLKQIIEHYLGETL